MVLYNAFLFKHAVLYSIDSQELQLSTSNAELSGDLLQNLNSEFSLGPEILSSIPQDRNVSITFTVYNSPALFPVRNTSQNMAVVSNTVVGSQVVSVQVGGIADGTRLDVPVTFLLRLTNTPDTGTNEFIASRRCAFWDFNAASKSQCYFCKQYQNSLLDGNGDWNTDGCTLTTFNQSTNVVDCQCNHLTNFACLVVSTLCICLITESHCSINRTYLLECKETMIQLVYQRSTFWHWMSQPMLVCSALSWV